MPKLYSLPPRILQTFAWLPTRFLLMFFSGFKVYGKENLERIDQAIFAVNHASELDPIVLTAALSPIGKFSPMFYVSAEVKKLDDPKRFGWRRHLYKHEWFFKFWGSYPIQEGLRNYEMTLKNHLKLLREGRSLCMFPEGKMTRDGSLGEGHGGIVFLHHKSVVPIVPVCIRGTFKTTFRGFLGGKHKIDIHFGKPLYFNSLMGIPDVSIVKYKEISQQVVFEISKCL